MSATDPPSRPRLRRAPTALPAPHVPPSGAHALTEVDEPPPGWASRRHEPASFLEFRRHCARVATFFDRQGEDYLEAHLRRFYDTYLFILRRYGVPDRLVSLGAGSAYVEAALATRHGTEVTVYDFPDALTHHGALYDRLRFEVAPIDLSQPAGVRTTPRQVDLILCAEIIEHLPVAPSVQFAHSFARIGADAPLVVTTPNSGSLRHLLKLLFMRPLLPTAELTFAECSYENEGVHRREYLPGEIRDAFRLVGHDLKAMTFTWYHGPQDVAEALIYPFELLTPRFRPCMILGSTRARRIER